MGSAILSGTLDSCARAQQEGAEARITRFIVTVNSAKSAGLLKARFEKYSDRLTVVHGDNIKAMEEADEVLLSCKPYLAEKVLTAHGVGKALQGKLVISVLAGSPIEKLEAFIKESNLSTDILPCCIIRAMMSTAAEFGESMTIIETTDVPEEFSEFTNWMFELLGKTAAVPPDLYNVGGVVAAVSLSLLSVAIDGILDGAVSHGLKRAPARAILAQGLIGLAKLLENGETPDTIREKASSPRGTTIEGLMSLEEDGARSAFCKATKKATHRSLTM
jgi:pyrroline-5-carboxylate reductase